MEATRAPSAVLFICTQNAIRSPMAAALMHAVHGHRIYVASAGIRAGDPDPFVGMIMDEVGLDLTRHRPHSVDDLADSAFDLFIAVRGWPIFALGVVGLLGGFFYTARPVGYKYFALGDALVFTLMGPLMVIGSHFVLTGSYNHAVLIASLPVGCLVAAILHANNMRDIQHDREAQVRTVANLLGHDRARFEYYGLVGGAYVAALGMIAGGLIGPWGLLVLLTVPLAARNIRRVARSQPQQPESIATLDVQTAQLHLVFGLLFALAILLGELLR